MNREKFRAAIPSCCLLAARNYEKMNYGEGLCFGSDGKWGITIDGAGGFSGIKFCPFCGQPLPEARLNPDYKDPELQPPATREDILVGIRISLKKMGIPWERPETEKKS